ncbi:hypothetical protein HYPDE_29223 [Hyphomicrobium denitrificans 1NES1]|uniref:Uncharacterized protein n=1 Tax=Hyphomicrobium denitrificans 1NES1 TaxID=670307 RepID=N0BBN6_9HYPH|nr:hypothetical protein HYPDE_29223 [Hyphomicrobium denitrificans 1NES1]
MPDQEVTEPPLALDVLLVLANDLLQSFDGFRLAVPRNPRTPVQFRAWPPNFPNMTRPEFGVVQAIPEVANPAARRTLGLVVAVAASLSKCNTFGVRARGREERK